MSTKVAVITFGYEVRPPAAIDLVALVNKQLENIPAGLEVKHHFMTKVRPDKSDTYDSAWCTALVMILGPEYQGEGNGSFTSVIINTEKSGTTFDAIEYAKFIEQQLSSVDFQTQRLIAATPTRVTTNPVLDPNGKNAALILLLSS